MSTHLARIATLLLLSAATSAPAWAGPAPSPEPSSLYLEWLSGWMPMAEPRAEHFRIGLDPETGEWGRAPVEQALQASGITPRPLVIHHSNGMLEVILEPGIVEYVVARIGPDGRPVLGCQPSGTHAPGPAVSSGPPDR
ncbi:MAG TPA: hypothetical protein VFQ05_00810 [Candidatus Eisenbacteria bacterium]|nr:hypothetical protein [Candidatus Eisenbacteria bacterium]